MEAFILIFHLIGGDFTIPGRHATREACELAARHYVAESQRLVPDKDRRVTWTCRRDALSLPLGGFERSLGD
jgi:hypothetical protein